MPDDVQDNYGSLNYRNVRRITLGHYSFDTWFGNSAPFLPNEPELLAYNAIHNGIKRSTSHRKVIEYAKTRKPWIDTLYFCSTCFKYSDDPAIVEKHSIGCPYRAHFPGKVMYCDDEVTIRKVKGSKHKLFCQCLCVLAKFFLDNKSVFYNLEHFDFYVIYKKSDEGISTPMGFYSRELISWEDNNLSCIMVIPCYQKQHLGTKLVDFSYRLSTYQQIISGPERPLSSLGRMTFLSYWSGRLCIEFLYGSLVTFKTLTLEVISRKTGFRVNDILMTLDYMKSFLESGKKDPYTDYYTERSHEKEDDEGDFVFLTDDNYQLYIDKSRLKQWVVDHHIRDEPILKEEGLILY
ncbi:DEKNAAC103360 [Brettanomyces naardenensis]|uniref:histone acetyltransferase n=1 Tax=Brettanomyces naardenensis TaxID=13370 RepID=A0A448YNI7_BRENA|nr:DEKNAAC103360 [Brettanomyces naardenensis]